MLGAAKLQGSKHLSFRKEDCFEKRGDPNDEAGTASPALSTKESDTWCLKTNPIP